MRAILDRLAALGIRVRLTEDGRLGLSPVSRIPPDLMAAAREHRDDIVAHLVRMAQAETRIRAWLAHIRETEPGMIDDVLARCAADPECLAYFMTRAREVPPVRREIGGVNGVGFIVEEEQGR